MLLEALIEQKERIKKPAAVSSHAPFMVEELSNAQMAAFRICICARRGNWQNIAGKLKPVITLIAKPIPTSENKPSSPTSIYAVTKQDQEQFCSDYSGALTTFQQ